MSNQAETPQIYSIVSECHEDRATMAYLVQPPVPLHKIGVVNFAIERSLSDPDVRETHGYPDIRDSAIDGMRERHTIQILSDPETGGSNVKLTFNHAFDNSRASFGVSVKGLLRSIVKESLTHAVDTEDTDATS
jgi:hypothetical protein